MKAHHEAPASLVSLLWSIATTIGVFLAVLISSFFVLKHYYPVSADQATALPVKGDCVGSSEYKIAVSNYPGINAVTKAYPDLGQKHAPVEKALGGNYQCSMYCIAGIDNTKSAQDPANLQTIKNYLTDKTMGGKPITIIQSDISGKTGGDRFVDMVKAATDEKDSILRQQKLDELKRTIILDYSKTKCAGYNQITPGGSVDYAKLLDKDGHEIKREEDNTTTIKPTTNNPTKPEPEDSSSQGDSKAIAGAPLQKFDLPTSSGETETEEEKWACIKDKSLGANESTLVFEWYYKVKDSESSGGAKWISTSTKPSIAAGALISSEQKNDYEVSSNPTEDCKERPTEPPQTKIDLETCKTKVSNFLKRYVIGYTSEEPYEQADFDNAKRYLIESESFDKQFMSIYQGNKDLNKEPYFSDNDKALAKCQEISKTADELDETFSDTKEQLSICKSQVNTFLNDFRSKTTTQELSNYVKRAYWLYWNIKYNPWYFFSAKNQLAACTAIQNDYMAPAKAALVKIQEEEKRKIEQQANLNNLNSCLSNVRNLYSTLLADYKSKNTAKITEQVMTGYWQTLDMLEKDTQPKDPAGNLRLCQQLQKTLQQENAKITSQGQGQAPAVNYPIDYNGPTDWGNPEPAQRDRSAQAPTQTNSVCTWDRVHTGSAWLGGTGVTLWRSNCYSGSKIITHANWIPISKDQSHAGYWALGFNNNYYWQYAGSSQWGRFSSKSKAYDVATTRLRGYGDISQQNSLYTKREKPPYPPQNLPATYSSF